MSGISAVIGLRVWLAVALMVAIAGMKWSSLRVAPLAGEDLRSFVRSPVLSVASWRRRRPLQRSYTGAKLRELALVGVALVTSWWLYGKVAQQLSPSPLLQGYLAVVPFYALIQCGSSVVELVFSASGWHYPPHMRAPFLARSIDEFWGRRWGVWVADWLRQVILHRYRRRPVVGVLMVFVVSGLWHELLVDVPLYLFFGVNILGAWLAYFAIQALGAVGEHLLFPRRSALSFIYAWIVILTPAPLALNEATLRAAGLWATP